MRLPIANLMGAGWSHRILFLSILGLPSAKTTMQRQEYLSQTWKFWISEKIDAPCFVDIEIQCIEIYLIPFPGSVIPCWNTAITETKISMDMKSSFLFYQGDQECQSIQHKQWKWNSPIQRNPTCQVEHEQNCYGILASNVQIVLGFPIIYTKIKHRSLSKVWLWLKKNSI